MHKSSNILFLILGQWNSDLFDQKNIFFPLCYVMRSQQNKYTHSRSYSCLLCSIQTERLITSWIYEWILGLSSDRKDFAKKWYEKGKVIINDTFSSPAFELHDYYSCLACLFTFISTADLAWHTSYHPTTRNSGNDFGRFPVSFFEGRISYIWAACNYPTRNANS